MISFRVSTFVIGLAGMAILCSGCKTMPGPNSRVGGVLGGTTGGLMGAAIGATEGKAGEGALIGAIAGATAGTVLGNEVDQGQAYQQSRRLEQEQVIRGRALTYPQIVEMTRSGLSDEVIINQIDGAGILNPPTTNDLIAMKNSGVSDRVISHLQSSPQRREPILVRQPVPYPRAPSGFFVFETGPRRPAPRHYRRHWH